MLSLATQEVNAVSKPISRGLAVQTEADLLLQAFHNCQKYLGGSWLKLKYSEVVFRKISGGLSNLLFSAELPDYVAVEDKEPRKVLARFYGHVNKQKAMEASDIIECVILTMWSERKEGPRLYGVFDGGRLEEYIPARPLLTCELSHPSVTCIVAEKMASIHNLEAPLEKRPIQMWQSMEQWMERIEDLLEQDPAGDMKMCMMIEKLQSWNLRTELTWLRQFLEQTSSPSVFCHNDMQEGNILLRSRNDGSDKDLSKITTDDIVIIDFEYSSYNHRGFDLANHFNEWKYDYKNDSPPYFWERSEEDQPSIEQKKMFLSVYLSKLKESPKYKECEESTVDHIITEVDNYSLKSHLLWALWSIVSSLSVFTTSISFDYWCYGEKRLEAYHKEKRNLLKNTQ